MPFVPSPFLGTNPRPTLPSQSARTRPTRSPRAQLHRRHDRAHDADDPPFRPFDGSQPLLPPWRPPSVEAAFSYTAQRVVSRDARAAPLPRLVRVRAPRATLFARVVQEVRAPPGAERAARLWLRPLLLDGDGEFVDLRGGSDLVLAAAQAEDVSGEMRVRVDVNLAATEADVVSRVVEDERWAEFGSKALLAFMQSLAEEGRSE